MSIWRYANPLEFMRLSGRLLAPLWVGAGVLMVVGLGLGVTMIMLPVGIVVGLLGVAIFVGGFFAHPSRRGQA